MRPAMLGALCAALLGVGCASTAPAEPAAPASPAPAPLQRLTLPFSQVTPNNAPWFIAHDGGFFERNGLEVELVNLGAGQPVQAALVSGEVVVAASSGASVVNAIAAGADIIIVGMTVDTLLYQLVARPEIGAIADLRGTTIGINRLGGNPHTALRLIMRHGGVEVDQEARVIQIGQQPERMAALRTGAIQATLLAPPLGTIAERDGMRILADSADLGLPYANGVLSMQRDWLRAQRDVARRVLQSLLDGKRAFRADRELTLRTLQHWLRVDDLTLLAETYNYYSKVIDDRALPRPEALQTVIDEIAEDHPAARALQPEDLVDPSLASEVR